MSRKDSWYPRLFYEIMMDIVLMGLGFFCTPLQDIIYTVRKCGMRDVVNQSSYLFLQRRPVLF